MSKHTNILAFFLLLVCILPAAAITNLGVQHGLSNAFITSIAEDSRGFIWVATEDGLNRWDGVRFQSFLPSNCDIPSSEFNCLLHTDDDNDALWVGSQRDGLIRIDCNTLEMQTLINPVIMTKDITGLYPGRNGGIWITHYHFGPQLFDIETGSSKKCLTEIIPNLPALSWTCAESSDNKLYIGHVNEGFSVVDTTARTFVNYRAPQLPGNSVYAICIDNNDNVWLGTDNGVALYNPVTENITPIVHDPADPGSIRSGAVRSIHQMKNGEIWFATSQGGVSILDVRGNAYSNIASAKFISLPTNGAGDGTSCINIRDIFQDSYGNIWIGNYSTGIDFISHIPELMSRVDYHNINGSGRYNPVWCTDIDNNGTIWVGSENEIASLGANGQVNTRIRLPEVSNENASYVRSILADGTRIWVGTNERGLLTYNTTTGRWQTIAGISGPTRTLAEHGDSIYIGTNNGLWRAARNSISAEPCELINSNLLDLVINSITSDSNGHLWIGSFGRGLSIFDSNGTLLATHSDGNFPSNSIHDVLHDRTGSTWVATRRGVVRFDCNDYNSYHKIAVIDELDVSHVMSLAEDNYGNIWLTTGNGIVRVVPAVETASLFNGSLASPMHSFVAGQTIKDASNLYFPSLNGLVRVHPATLEETVEHMPAEVTRITVYKGGIDTREPGRDVLITDNRVKLPYNENTFSITFSVPDYALMAHAEFCYKMEGLDNTWTMISGENVVNFRSISSGSYKFLIRQRPNGGDWLEPELIATITVEPPLWLTWWAKLIYALALLGLISALIYMAWHRYAMKRRLIIERERSRNSQILTEECLRFYTNVTHELRTPLTLIMGPLEDIVSDPLLPAKFSYKLQIIRNSANSLMSLINGILEFRKTETLNRRLTVRKANPANLLREIGLRFKELNQNPNTEIVFDIEKDSPDMYFDHEMLTVIINNLVSNAVKYTPKGSITLGFKTTTDADGVRHSTISVADTGFGISEKALEHIFERYFQANGNHQADGTGIGLNLVRKLAVLHEAKLEVKSTEGKGSIFSFTLTTDNTYPEAIHMDFDKISPKQEAENKSADDNTENDSLRKILVIEDNDDIREYIRQTLASEYDIVTAHNGLEGLSLINTEQPDIVISDIMMPEMDGITLCRNIKDNLITSHIPVILLTAKDSLSDKEDGYESGADSYMTKPFSAKLLRSRIHNLLINRRHMAEYLLSKSVATYTVTPEQELEASIDTAVTADEAASNLTLLDRQFLEKLLDIINNNLSNEDLSVAFLSDKMCMSNSTLYRKVTALLGISPNEYIRRLRISRAVELLKSGLHTITEIAFNTGFGSHSSFSRVFKKEFGMTPTEYQNKNLK